MRTVAQVSYLVYSAACERPMFELSNYIESGFGGVLGVGFMIHAARCDAARRRANAVLAITLVLFALSDVVEVRTGAWWRPWWLLAWKASCLCVMAVITFRYYRGRGQGNRLR